MKLLAGGVALTMASLGGLVAVTAVPAFANATSAAYTIGAPSGTVENVAITPTTGTSGVAQTYQVSFTATAALAESTTSSDDGTITITPTPAWTGTPTNVELIDSTSGCFQSGVTGAGSTATSADTDTGITIALDDSCPTIAVSQVVDVDFSVPATANFTVTVGTSANSTSAASNTVTISSVPPAVAENSQAFGYPAVYTFTSVGATGAACSVGGDVCGWSGLSANVTAVQITATGVPSGDNVDWDASGAFSASYTSGSTTTSDTVTVAIPSPNVLDLTLGTSVPAGDTLTITAQGTNPGVASSDTFTIEPLDSTPPTITGDPNTAGATPPGPFVPTEVTPSVAYGTQVLDVTAAASPSVASATATYTVAFKAQTAVTGGDGDVVLEETSGPTDFGSITGVLVKDVTANWLDVPNAVTTTPTPGVPTVTDNTPEAAPSTLGGTDDILAIPFPAGDSIAAGDTVNLTLVGVTNPTAQTVSDLDVWTTSSLADQGDSVSSPAASYTIGASGAASPVVTPANSTAGATTNYTVTNLYASEALTTAAEETVVLTAPAGTVLPDAAGYYTFTDDTTAAGSGTASAIADWTPTSVEVTAPNADILSGDLLTLSIADVVNPSTSGSYTMTFTGEVQGPSVIAPFPQANTTYPNGSIVDFSGTDYLFAGGHAFGIATPTLLAKLQAVDHATVLKAAAGSILPTTAPRSGTLITTNSVNGNATIYAVGADGELHGFSTSEQFTGDGYDPALTVTVPMLGGLTTGSTAGVEGTALTALATSADGAIVDSTGTYYVFDGGKAFGIPTPTWLTAVRKDDTATPLTGSIGSTQTGAGIASGVLLTVSGEVYVSYVGDIFPFKSETQLSADGYAGTAAITLPNLGGLAVVAGYSGS